jgi:hypothetical protein
MILLFLKRIMRLLLIYIFIPCLFLLNGKNPVSPAAGQYSPCFSPGRTAVQHIKDQFTDQQELACLPDQSILPDDNDNEDDESSSEKKKSSQPLFASLCGKIFFVHCNAGSLKTTMPCAIGLHRTFPVKYILHRSIRV